ncbi:MAG: LysR family transcriptional regulator [Alphaproteobacteria bacterium]|nr:LysR family transcriptional regulator [Alphaproteobacteria bacterium]
MAQEAPIPDLNALVVFAKVVEANSFSEAARRLKMPVSTVSRRIAELEDELGVRLLDRSTRNLRLTELGTEVLEQAIRSAELSEAVNNIVSNRLSTVSGTLRLSAPPTISDTLLTPIVTAFQASYPDVRVQIFVTDRYVDHIAEGIDLAFRLGALRDSSLVARKVLAYRRQLVASPDYLKSCRPPEAPRDLLDHPLLAFWRREPEASWSFVHKDGRAKETITFSPYLSMNDFAGLTPALLAGRGIGELPPVVQPELVRTGRLVEVIPDWRFPPFDLSIVHLGNRHLSKPCRLFKEFATQMTQALLPDLPA